MLASYSRIITLTLIFVHALYLQVSMDVVSAARSLIGDTLAFHLLFVTFGVGLPLIISGTELYGLIKKRPRAIGLAHTWSKMLVVLFIAGAVSGTIVSLQFSLLWPTFMALAGKVVGVAFALEGFAFLVEALFLSIYMLSWDRVKPWVHWLIGLPVVLGSLTSAYFITTVNAWMQTPQGFQLDSSGNPININVRKAIFNPSAGIETSHSILAYIFTTVLVLAAIYAWLILRRKNTSKTKAPLQKVLYGLVGLSLFFALLVGLAGDQAGKFDAKHEPYKLAAAEGLQNTQPNAPLLIGGVVDGSNVKYAIRVPNLLSWLATGKTNGVVQGINSTPADERPPVYIHYFFDGMVGIGTLGVIVPVIYLAFRRLRSSAPMLVGLIVMGGLGLIGIELGWLFTEFGRQPYVIRGVMRVADASTRSHTAVEFAYLFPLFYIALIWLTIKALKRSIRPEEAFES